MGSKSVERGRMPKPTFRRRGDFSPVSTLAAGDLMSEMHEVTQVSQLSVPSLTTEDRDETDEISARQPSDREACRWPEGLGVPMVRTPGGWQSDATQSNGWIARTISERDGGSEGRRRTSGRHQR